MPADEFLYSAAEHAAERDSYALVPEDIICTRICNRRDDS